MSFNLSLIDKYSAGDNLRSFLLYNFEFAQCTSEDLLEKDLLKLPLSCSPRSHADTDNSHDLNYLPFLLNGSNQYGLLRGVPSKSQELPTFARQVCSMGGNFFVMPEAQTVYELQISGAKLGDLSLGLSSWINMFSDQFSLTRIFLQSISEFNSIHMMRWFDSHLSMTAYTLFCLVYLKFLGYEHSSPTFVTQLLHDALILKSYTPDLAVRLSEKKSYAHLPSRALVVEKKASPDGKLRGSYLMFANQNSFLIDRELFLFGDSHSFSFIAPLLSQTFRRVHIFWGLPDDYSKFVDQYCGFILSASSCRVLRKIFLEKYSICLMGKLLLHIGSEKAGSTSLQSYLNLIV